MNVAELSINILLLPSSSLLSGVWPMGPTAAASQTDPTLFLKVSNSYYSTRSTKTCFGISLPLEEPHPRNLYNRMCVIYVANIKSAAATSSSIKGQLYCILCNCLSKRLR